MSRTAPVGAASSARYGFSTTVRARAGELVWFGARVIAFWFGALTLLNVVAAIRHPAFDANVWWIDLSFLPTLAGSLIVTAAGVLLVAYAVRPAAGGVRRGVTLAAVGALVVGALVNTATYYRVWAAHAIAPRVPVPLSLVIALLLTFVGVAMRRPVTPPTRRRRVTVIAAASALFVVGLPLLQMTFFGTTDYRRPAQAIVVFGAQVEPSGRASFALADRVATGTVLYRAGLAPLIVMSGGVEPSGHDETIVMRDLAEGEGVPADAIVLDRGGVDTLATVNDTARLFARDGIDRVLAVSQYYHLPRIKLAYARAGYDVWTVPSRDTPINQSAWLVVREIPAFWLYYLRAAVT